MTLTTSMRTRLRSAALPILALIGSANLAMGQQFIYVDSQAPPGGDGTQGAPFATIQEGIDSPLVVDYDWIRIRPGVYVENLMVDKTLSFGPDPGVSGSVIIEGESPLAPAVSILGTQANFYDLTVRNSGSAFGLSGGGGFSVQSGALLAYDVQIENCAAQRGGGIFAEDSHIQGDFTIQGCEAGQGGGIWLEDSSMFSNAVTVENCRATGEGGLSGGFARGGGLCAVDSEIAVLGTARFLQNTALLQGFGPNPAGGGLYVDGGELELYVADIQGNRSGDSFDQWPSGSGGGSFVTCGTITTISNATYSGNVAGGIPAQGGGHRGPGTFTNCRFENNDAEHGGGLSSTGCTLSLSACELIDNRNSWEYRGGGGIAGPATIDASTISGNWSSTGGGGALDCTLTDCAITENEVQGTAGIVPLGGGLLDCVAVDCQIEGNRVVRPVNSPDLPRGGGLSGGSATRCTIVGNTADGLGMGSFGGGASEAYLERCVLTGNAADRGAAASDCDLMHSTVTANGATTGGAVENTAGSLHSIDSCIVWGNTPTQIVADLNTAVLYSDVEGGSLGFDNLDVDPGFWHPISGDLHLLPGSPLVDLGNPGSAPDPDGTRADIGAYWADASYDVPPANYCTGLVNSQGCSAAMSASGTPTQSGADDFYLEVDGAISGLYGIFIYSLGAQQQPFQGATLCVSQPLHRTTPQLIAGPGACGTAQIHVSKAMLANTVGTQPFRNVYAQFWYRDNQAPPYYIALSDGLEFVLRP